MPQHHPNARNPGPMPVLWIGGGCGAGKSTLARSLAHRLDLRLYPIDAYTFDHQARSADLPVTRALGGGTFAQRWLQPSIDEQVERFVAHAAERFAVVIEDLARTPAGPGVVVEGPQLLPELLRAHLPSPDHTVWLLPAEQFIRRARTEKGVADPDADAAEREEKLQCLIERDVRLTSRLRAELATAGFTGIEVDGSRSPSETEAVVRAKCAGPLGELPRARDGAERQRIRQAENGVICRQLGAYWAWLRRRPGKPRPPASTFAFAFAFACECRTLGCAALTPELTIPAYEALRAAGRAATAPGHRG